VQTDAFFSVSAFLEVRYDVAPQWYLAGRVDGMGFGEIDAGPTNGGVQSWDEDVFRTDFAIGYRVTREVLLEADWQHTTTGADGWTQNLFAAQLSTVF
jgi:hypothetical protein